MAVFTKGLYNCACSRTVCDWSCTTYATMMSDLVPNTVVGYVPPLKKTNADRIRAMTGEEIAKFLRNEAVSAYNSELPLAYDDFLNWLKQETDNGQN